MLGLLIFIQLSFAGEVVESQREVLVIDYTPGTVAAYGVRLLKSQEKFTYEKRDPVVEGQKIVYIHPRGPGYNELYPLMQNFFVNWAESCTQSKAAAVRADGQSARDNYVASYSGNMSQVNATDYLTSILQTRRPHSLIFQYKKQTKVLNEDKWDKILKHIPSHMGCLILSPLTGSDNFVTQQNYKTLKKILTKANSSCQLVNVDREVREKAKTEAQPIFSGNGMLTGHGLKVWFNEFKRQTCDLDPRSYAEPERRDISSQVNSR